MYYSHMTIIRKLDANAHLNMCLKHFIYFTNEFHLIEKSHLKPLQDVIDEIISRDNAQKKTRVTYASEHT